MEAVKAVTYSQEVSHGGGVAAHFRRNRIFWVGGAVALALAIAIRIYQHAMSFTVGTDYYEPDFQKYWMSLLYIEVVVLAAVGVISSVYVWLTRETDASAISPQLELKRYFTLLGVLCVIAVWASTVAALAIESDASWHQVTIRDTDFTPTHIVIFYFAIPLLTAILVPTFIWAHTRIPAFMNRISIPFLAVVCGIFMIMPNYGFNEWGHTFFYAEELFAAPIHYGFVVLGWSLFFLVPLAIQMIQRMAQLIGEVSKEQNVTV